MNLFNLQKSLILLNPSKESNLTRILLRQLATLIKILEVNILDNKRTFLIITLIGFLFVLNRGGGVLEHQQTPNTLTSDRYQMSNEHKHIQKTSPPLPLPSITQSGLPPNLVVTFDNSHTPSAGQTAINLEGNLTAAGSTFHTIDGVFSIPADTNVLLIPCSNSTYTTDELNIINNWFTSDGARLLWVTGDSDYAGYFNNAPSNDILTRVGSKLRISADSVYDAVYNDNASYRVAVQTPISDGDLNSIFTNNVSSVIMHGPTSVLGYQSGAVVDLNETSIAGIEIIMKTSIEATPLDSDFTGTELDYYSTANLNGSYPMMAIQDMSDRKSVIVSAEAIFSDYQHMYDLFTDQGTIGNPYAWNGGYHEGKTLVDNVLAWFGKVVEKRIHMILATGGLGDRSQNDAAYQGYLLANETFSESVALSFVEPENPDSFSSYQVDAADSAEFDLIICIGFLQKPSLDSTTEAYPDQKWVLVDDFLDKSNVRSVLFKEHEGSFLVGAMASMTTQTGKLGFLGGMDNYLINKFLAGYQAGAHYIHDGTEVTAVYDRLPSPDCWIDFPGGKKAGETLIKQGHDIIFTAAGETGHGTFEAVAEAERAYAIGVDSDEDYYHPGKILCSMVKKVETAVYNSIRDVVYGNFSDENQQLGIAEDGVGISPMTYTSDIKNGDFTFNSVTKTRWGWIEDIKGKIIDGSIIVPEVPDWDRMQIITYPTQETTIPVGYTTTTSTEEDETTTTSFHSGISIPSPGFELSLLIWTMCLAVLWIKRKK